MASGSPTYENFEHTEQSLYESVAELTEQTPYQIVTENEIEATNEYTELKDKTDVNCSPKLDGNSSHSNTMPSRTARRFNYTDVMISNVTEANKVTKDTNSHVDSSCNVKKTPPLTLPKPKKMTKDRRNINMAKKWNKIHVVHYISCWVITAGIAVVAIAALVVAVLSYGSLQQCEHLTESDTCEIISSITLHRVDENNLEMWLLNYSCSTPSKTENLSKVNLDIYYIMGIKSYNHFKLHGVLTWFKSLMKSRYGKSIYTYVL